MPIFISSIFITISFNKEPLFQQPIEAGEKMVMSFSLLQAKLGNIGLRLMKNNLQLKKYKF